MATVTTNQPSVTTYLPTVPITRELKVPEDLDKKIADPWKPRANQAVSAENPNPPTDAQRSKQTVLQQHVDFWDADRDGKIYPWDTYRGFHQIGFNAFLSFIAVFVIHGTFSYPTQDGWMPDPLFSLKLKNMHKAKHGSDSGTYDRAGRFIPANFESIFATFDVGNKGGLTLQELWRMTQSTREVWDPVGWTAMKLEWGALWWVAHDENSLVSKEKIRGQYDGSLFYLLAEENKKKAAAKAAHRTNAVPWLVAAVVLVAAALAGSLLLKA